MVDTFKCFRQVCKICSKNVIIIPCLFTISNYIKETVQRTVPFPKFTLVFPENSVKICLIVEEPFKYLNKVLMDM